MSRRVVTSRIERAGAYAHYERTAILDGMPLLTEAVYELDGVSKVLTPEGEEANMILPEEAERRRITEAADITRKLTFIYGKPTS